MSLRAALVLACLALGPLVGCSGDDPGAGPASPSGTPVDAVPDIPTMGATQVLVPAPGDDGLLLVTGNTEADRSERPLGMWRWDGEAWSAVTPSGDVPRTRNFFAAALDEDRDVLVLHGGLTTDGLASDETWEWDGESWTLSAGPGPGRLSSPSLTWDPVSGQTILYGGAKPDGGIPDATWAWDGQEWTRLAKAGPSPGRWPGATVPDGEGRVLLYGGHQVADPELPAALRDTWAWTGEEWLPEPDAGGPGPLVNGHGLWHPELGALLVGGSDLRRPSGDVWVWREGRWQLFAEDVFPDRQAFGLAHDPERDVVVLTGGLVRPGGTTRHQDVWEWSGDPAEPAVRVDRRPPA